MQTRGVMTKQLEVRCERDVEISGAAFKGSLDQ